MKIYTANNTETDDGIEILLKHQELQDLVNALTKFDDEVKQFKTKNEDVADLGVTHLHLKDCGIIDENSKSDIIFYVDLNDK